MTFLALLHSRSDTLLSYLLATRGTRSKITPHNNVPEEQNSESGQRREHRGNRLPQSNGSRDRGASQYDGGQETELKAVGLAVLLSVTAEDV